MSAGWTACPAGRNGASQKLPGMSRIARIEEGAAERGTLEKRGPIDPEPLVVANHPGAIGHLETFNLFDWTPRTTLPVADLSVRLGRRRQTKLFATARTVPRRRDRRHWRA
jgi:hypothetical protein